jgi:NADP-dependent aldehyde dehydrogenase
VNQLRQGAAAARDRSWCHATIDTKVNIRSKYGPLGGAVVVFGPNNFPFAFNSIAGGDFVAAIAAGNPVIGKANTGHPGTSKMLAGLALDAAASAGLPPAMIQLIYRTPPDVGLRLVSHPGVGATGFTGSKEAGLRLKDAADSAGKPIYLEMSSTNPVFLLPGALAKRGPAIARELYDSCALGAGQFCTRPGITVVLEGAQAEAFLADAAAHFDTGIPGTLLGPGAPPRIADGIGALVAHGASIVAGGREIDGPRYAFSNTLLRASGGAFLSHPHALQTEAFGTVNLVIVAKDANQMIAIAANLEGNLTGSIYSDASGGDDELYARVEAVLRQKVGRLLNDKMPTGVAVTPAMNHGGPFPATGHPGFTAVGIPASLLRFAALHCYDNVRPHRLPPELADKNPTGRMWRLIDGEWSQQDAAG